MANQLEREIESIEKKTARQISKEYNDALKEAIKKANEYFKKVKDVESGKIKPPSGLKTDKQIEGWKKAYKTRLMKKYAVIQSITVEMQNAGVKVRKSIIDSIVSIYTKSRNFTIDLLNRKYKANLPDIDRRKIRTLLYGKENINAFSKVAFNRLGNGKNVASELRRQMAESIARGETREQLLKRIMRITGAEVSDAMRILRTESTRIESMAQQEAAMEHYRATGIRSKKRWVCIFQNSRDSHMDLDGQEVYVDEPFHIPGGGTIMYPGDNNAPAEEVINCQCYMEVFEA